MYLLVESVVNGVDRTRQRYAADKGSLWEGINGHVSRGGDFEKRKAFVPTYTLPAGTIGMASRDNGLIVFGSDVAPGGMPADVTYVRLQNGAHTLTEILSYDLFNGKEYVIAKYNNGDIRHFYNGSLVSSWGAGGNSPTGYGTLARTFKRKVYSPIGSVLWFSQLDTPTVFDITQSGSGFQNMANQQSGSDDVTGLGVYQNYMAVFSRRYTQIWDMQDDDANNAPVQYIAGTGTRAPRSVVGFGEVDAFYLSDQGIRSIRARSGTNLAGVNDVGTPIDTIVREQVLTLSDAQVQRAIGLIEPVDSRFWMIVGERIYVFSYFPSKKVGAWSWYETGIEFNDAVVLVDRIYLRSGDVIYTYGGVDNATFDDCEVTVALPFLTSDKPGHFKTLQGIDIAAQNEWRVRLLTNPNDESQYVDAGLLEGVTFGEANIPVMGHTTHIAPVLTCKAGGPASFSMLAVYLKMAEES